MMVTEIFNNLIDTRGKRIFKFTCVSHLGGTSDPCAVSDIVYHEIIVQT